MGEKMQKRRDRGGNARGEMQRGKNLQAFAVSIIAQLFCLKGIGPFKIILQVLISLVNQA